MLVNKNEIQKIPEKFQAKKRSSKKDKMMRILKQHNPKTNKT